MNFVRRYFAYKPSKFVENPELISELNFNHEEFLVRIYISNF